MRRALESLGTTCSASRGVDPEAKSGAAALPPSVPMTPSNAGRAPIDSHHGRWYVSGCPFRPTQIRGVRAAR